MKMELGNNFNNIKWLFCSKNLFKNVKLFENLNFEKFWILFRPSMELNSYSDKLPLIPSCTRWFPPRLAGDQNPYVGTYLISTRCYTNGCVASSRYSLCWLICPCIIHLLHSTHGKLPLYILHLLVMQSGAKVIVK